MWIYQRVSSSASYSCVYRSQYLQTSTNISLYGGRGEGEVPYTAGGESPFILAKVVGIICSIEGPAQTANGKGRHAARNSECLMKLATFNRDTTSNTFFLCSSHTITAYRCVFAEEYLPHEKATPGGR